MGGAPKTPKMVPLVLTTTAISFGGLGCFALFAGASSARAAAGPSAPPAQSRRGAKRSDVKFRATKNTWLWVKPRVTLKWVALLNGNMD